jgi:hypothetical protein
VILDKLTGVGLRKLLTLPRRPGAARLEVSHAGGRHLYLEAHQAPVTLAVRLDPAEVSQLVTVLSLWLSSRERCAELHT